MLSTNQIAEFLSFDMSKTVGVMKLKRRIDDVILDEHCQACPGMPKEAIKLSGSPFSCNMF